METNETLQGATPSTKSGMQQPVTVESEKMQTPTQSQRDETPIRQPRKDKQDKESVGLGNSGQQGVYGYPRPDKRNHCNFSRIDLNGADLSNANLENADLSYANLAGATLFQANLSGVSLSGADLSQAVMPNGSINP